MGRSLNPATDILVAWMRPPFVAGAFMDSLLDLHDAWGGLQRHSYESGPTVGDTKNRLIDDFLNLDLPLLLLVDADMVFTPAHVLALVKLLDTDHIPAGFCKRASGEPLLQLRDEDGEYHQVTDWPREQTIEVDNGGAGALLLQAELLEKLRRDDGWPWFHYGPVNGHSVDDCYGFWQNANDHGIKALVPTDHVWGHAKTTVVV